MTYDVTAATGKNKSGIEAFHIATTAGRSFLANS